MNRIGIKINTLYFSDLLGILFCCCSDKYMLQVFYKNIFKQNIVTNENMTYLHRSSNLYSYFCQVKY